jgi:hypothetical protein
MSFFTKLARIFVPAVPADRYLHFQVKCNRCGEVLSGRLDVFNDPSLEDENGKMIYFCRKVLTGSGHCHLPVETIFKFNESRHIIDKQVKGGIYIDT